MTLSTLPEVHYVHGEEVKVGDKVIVMGTRRPITAIEPSEHPLSDGDWREASVDGDFHMMLVPGELYVVFP